MTSAEAIQSLVRRPPLWQWGIIKTTLLKKTTLVRIDSKKTKRSGEAFWSESRGEGVLLQSVALLPHTSKVGGVTPKIYEILGILNDALILLGQNPIHEYFYFSILVFLSHSFFFNVGESASPKELQR